MRPGQGSSRRLRRGGLGSLRHTLVMSAEDRTSSAFADVRGAVGMLWNGSSKVKQERSAKITSKGEWVIAVTGWVPRTTFLFRAQVHLGLRSMVVVRARCGICAEVGDTLGCLPKSCTVAFAGEAIGCNLPFGC